MDKGRLAEFQVGKENGKWLGYEGKTLYVQLKKYVADPLNKLTVVIVSLSGTCHVNLSATFCSAIGGFGCDIVHQVTYLVPIYSNLIKLVPSPDD